MLVHVAALPTASMIMSTPLLSSVTDRMSVTRLGELRSKAFVAPRETRWMWCLGELVVKIVVEGRARRRSWIAAAPTPELPPRIRIELGWEPEGSTPGMYGREI